MTALILAVLVAVVSALIIWLCTGLDDLEEGTNEGYERISDDYEYIAKIAAKKQ